MDGAEPSVLGQTVRGPVEQLDVIATDGVDLLREVASTPMSWSRCARSRASPTCRR